jgi:pimeloyl-ACP methyl ester carboxylesterase
MTGTFSAVATGRSPRTFVLVHGAWHGAWVWGDVAQRLRALGHIVTTPTLTGLGERRALSQAVDLETHIQDVMLHIEMEDLRDVDLVGWSYGGMVTTSVQARMPERIRSLIYLDAFVPEDGKSLVDYAGDLGAQVFGPYRDKDEPIPPFPLPAFGVTDPVLTGFIVPRLADQPWRTFFQAARVPADKPDVPTTYVFCSETPNSAFGQFYEKLQGRPQTKVMSVATVHHCMLTKPAETADILSTSV